MNSDVGTSVLAKMGRMESCNWALGDSLLENVFLDRTHLPITHTVPDWLVVKLSQVSANEVRQWPRIKITRAPEQFWGPLCIRHQTQGMQVEWLLWAGYIYTSSVQFSRSIVSNSLQPHGLQHARPPCPSPTPGIYPNSCPLSWWCHPIISSSVVPFSSCPLTSPASQSFQMSQLFASGGQSIGVSVSTSVSTSVLPMNTQDWSPLGWTGWICLQSKGLSILSLSLIFLSGDAPFSPCAGATLVCAGRGILQHHSSKASILQCSVFFIVQLSHPYMTSGKTIALKALILRLAGTSLVVQWLKLGLPMHGVWVSIPGWRANIPQA